MSFNCILPAIMCMIYRSYMLIQKWKMRKWFIIWTFCSNFLRFSCFNVWNIRLIFHSMMYKNIIEKRKTRDKCKSKKKKTERNNRKSEMYEYKTTTYNLGDELHRLCIYFMSSIHVVIGNDQIMMEIYHYMCPNQRFY